MRGTGWLASLLAAPLLLSGCALIVPQTDSLRTHWPDDLAQRAELDSVPFFPQKDYQCGPASLATLMAHSGVSVVPDDLVAKVYLPSRGGSLQVEMLAAARSHGLVSWKLAPKFDDVLREVEAGTPVIVMQDYGLWPISYWHYAVVVGFDRGAGKAVLRSGEKRRLEMPFAVLEFTWKESAYWAMVAVPPDRIPVSATEAAWLEAVVAMERVAGHKPARVAYGALLRRWPQSLNGAIGLANVDYAEHDLPAAEAALRQALKHHPASVVALNNLAQVLADQSRHDEALKLIDEAVALGGPFASAAKETRSQILMKMTARR